MIMRYCLLLLGVTLFALCTGPTTARADLSSFQFSVTEGEYYPLERAEFLFGGGVENAVALLDIGFPFNFDGIDYEQFSVSSNGLVGFGPDPVTFAPWNSLTATDEVYTLNNVPQITAFWDQLMYDRGSGVLTEVIGEEGNRIRVIEFQNVLPCIQIPLPIIAPFNWQIRLYEGSNRIEFYYGFMEAGAYSCDGVTIGMAKSPEDFLSIWPDREGGAFASSEDVNDSWFINEAPIPEGTLFVFEQCNGISFITGDVEQGGTEEMANGDNLLSRIQVMSGNQETFMPFTVSQAQSPCKDLRFNYFITGENAADYSVSPSFGTLIGPGGANTPEVTFTPHGAGERSAMLHVIIGGNEYSYNLVGEGLPRIQWEGHIAQGGTPDMANGDILLDDYEVLRHDSREYTPFTISNINFAPTAPDVRPISVTYELEDPTGQYSISPLNESLDGGESSTPVITFNPTIPGRQTATLIVTTDGNERTFTLGAYSVAPAADFTVNGEIIGSGSAVYTNVYECLATPVVYEMSVTNVNRVNFVVEGVDIFQTESEIIQGTPRYPLMRDEFGELIRFTDYLVTEEPGISPYHINEFLQFPIILEPGESKKFYLTFLPQRAGQRFARAFLRSNGENFSGTDVGAIRPGNPNPEQIEGRLTFDLFGRGRGPVLSVLDAVVFPATKPGETVEQKVTVQNFGACDLRISQRDLKIYSGDAQDFEIVSAFPNSDIDAATDDYLLPPGGADDITIRFKPHRYGSRRAAIWLRTNDSSVANSHFSERGTYYLDLYGRGTSVLIGRDVLMNPAVLGGASSKGRVPVQNPSTTIVEIESIKITGPNASDFAEDPANPWPSMPATVLPGDFLSLGVVFNPAPSGSPGERRAFIEIKLSSGETTLVLVRAEAGTRTLAVAPGSLFQNMSLDAGESIRRFVVVSNNGTLPVRIQSMNISGTSKDDYSFVPLRRLIIEPGQSEFIEVTFAPQASGSSGAMLQIITNTLNGTPAGTHTVTLGGMSTSVLINSGSGSVNNSGSTAEEQARTSGIDSRSAAGTLMLSQSVPNPSHETADITYSLAEKSNVILALYDAEGRMVRMLDLGVRESGTHSVRVDVEDLSSGTYHYTLQTNGEKVSRSLIVVN